MTVGQTYDQSFISMASVVNIAELLVHFLACQCHLDFSAPQGMHVKYLYMSVCHEHSVESFFYF